MAVGYNPENPVVEAGEPQQYLGQFPVGAAPLKLTHQYKNADGTPIGDISGFDLTITFEYEGDGTPPTLGTGTHQIEDGATAVVSYQWMQDDMTAVGFYRVQLWADNNANFFHSDVFTYHVYDGPGTPPT